MYQLDHLSEDELKLLQQMFAQTSVTTEVVEIAASVKQKLFNPREVKPPKAVPGEKT